MTMYCIDCGYDISRKLSKDRRNLGSGSTSDPEPRKSARTSFPATNEVTTNFQAIVPQLFNSNNSEACTYFDMLGRCALRGRLIIHSYFN